jgi:hypothetical protein
MLSFYLFVLQASTVGHVWHRGAAAQSSPSSLIMSSIEEISEECRILKKFDRHMGIPCTTLGMHERALKVAQMTSGRVWCSQKGTSP